MVTKYNVFLFGATEADNCAITLRVDELKTGGANKSMLEKYKTSLATYFEEEDRWNFYEDVPVISKEFPHVKFVIYGHCENWDCFCVAFQNGEIIFEDDFGEMDYDQWDDYRSDHIRNFV